MCKTKTKAKILVIDDEEDICELSKKILEKTGNYEVVFSTTGKEGLDSAKQHKPDLILLDIMMPDMDGSKVAEYLSIDPATKEIPVAFLTALIKKEEAEADEGKIGSHFFIAKPISSQELIVQVKDILDTVNRK